MGRESKTQEVELLRLPTWMGKEGPLWETPALQCMKDNKA